MLIGPVCMCVRQKGNYLHKKITSYLEIFENYIVEYRQTAPHCISRKWGSYCLPRELLQILPLVHLQTSKGKFKMASKYN